MALERRRVKGEQRQRRQGIHILAQTKETTLNYESQLIQQVPCADQGQEHGQACPGEQGFLKPQKKVKARHWKESLRGGGHTIVA